MRWVIALICAGCSSTPAPVTSPSPPPPPPPPPADAAGAPEATPAPLATCTADAAHCCDPKTGQLVVPGGCQPSYPDNVVPSTERGPDGMCVQIPCFKKCLPADARIATPHGEVAISALHPGDLVWTLSSGGARIAAPVIRVRSIPVTAAHSVRVVTLADGRTFRASAGHPLLDGSLVGALQPGARVGGVTITTVSEEPYSGSTWDLLPAGATGAYWSDGVVLGSTLLSGEP